MMPAHEVLLDPAMKSTFGGATLFYDANQQPFMDERGMANVFGYNNTLRVLTDRDTFVRNYFDFDAEDRGGPKVPPQGDVERAIWGRMEPHHSDYQAPLTAHFSPHAIENRLTGRIDRALGRIVKEVLESDVEVIDYHETFGRVPGMIIGEYVGMDASDPVIRNWIEKVNTFSATDDDEIAVRKLCMDAYRDAARTLSDDAKPRNPVEGLVQAVREGHLINGKPMTELDIIGNMKMLLVSAQDTTAESVAGILQSFGAPAESGKKNVLERLYGAPSDAIHTAAEEGWRRNTASTAIMREAADDVTIENGGGKLHIPKGTKVMAWITSANFDSVNFDDPYALDITRNENEHLSFAEGKVGKSHSWFCTGRAMARAIGERTLYVASNVLPMEWDGQDFNRDPGFVATVPKGSLHFIIDRDKAQRWAADRAKQDMPLPAHA